MSFISLELDTPDLARHYEQVSSTIQFLAGQRLAAMLGVAAGEKILDVGCGAGQLAEHLADLTGERGLVIGVDPLPRRIELAQRRARPNLRFQVDNAYDLSAFAPDSFDAVYLNVVFHWLPEKIEPLRRFHALLKAGGRLALSAPMAGHIYRIQAIKAEVLSREPYTGYPEGLNGRAHPVDADELTRLLMATGYATPRIEIIRDLHHFPTAENAFAFWEASSFGNVLGHLPEALRLSAREEIAARLEETRSAEGIPHEAVRVYAVADKL